MMGMVTLATMVAGTSALAMSNVVAGFANNGGDYDAHDDDVAKVEICCRQWRG